MFLDFGIKDFIDILLVAFLLYYTYKLMKASGSINVFTGLYPDMAGGIAGVGDEAVRVYL